MDRTGSFVQPAAQVGDFADSAPTTPTRTSVAWVVVAVPEEKAAVVPVAPAVLSSPVTPANSSTLTWVSADDGYVSLMLPPATSAFTPTLTSAKVRSLADPSLVSRATT